MKSLARDSCEANATTVFARSLALTPVEISFFTSTLTVKAVFFES